MAAAPHLVEPVGDRRYGQLVQALSQPHAVGAITDHLIVAVGAPHKPIDATDRMRPVPYEEIIADDGELTCMICDKTAGAPRYLHSVDCPHCPCQECNKMPG